MHRITAGTPVLNMWTITSLSLIYLHHGDMCEASIEQWPPADDMVSMDKLETHVLVRTPWLMQILKKVTSKDDKSPPYC